MPGQWTHHHPPFIVEATKRAARTENENRSPCHG